MPDVLTQAEIDELLNSLISGGDPEPKTETAEVTAQAKIYDFRTANRFPKEQIRTFNVVFQNFAQLFSNLMTAILRTSCECDLTYVEEITFNEFNNSLPTPVVLMIFKAPPMSGSLMMEISPECGYMIINRLLGGSYANTDTGKSFTDIDMALLRRVFRQLLQIFKDAWDKIIDLKPEMERTESSTQFAQICALTEPVAVITMNLKIGGESGLISVCIPHTAIEPIAKQLKPRLYYHQSGIQQDEDAVERQYGQIAGKLMHSRIPLSAIFDTTPAKVSDIVNLQVGDVIRLNHRIHDPLTVKVQHIPKFHAQIGSAGKNYALKITDIIREEDEDESFARRN